MQDRFDAAHIEPKWQARWSADRLFLAETTAGQGDGERFYLLEMLPYPSGRIHMGHVRNYSIGDVLARILRMQGKRVMHPMGWDAFGLPAENAAIKGGVHPAKWTWSNIAHMRTQMQRLGYSYDWSREVASCSPDYYRFEQLVFLKMYERGIAYRKRSSVNFCPSCATVLANEQVVSGRCWRCNSVVEAKDLEQWFLRITDHAQNLLQGLSALEGKWPDSILAMQRNWIGRSEGARIRFPLIPPAADVDPDKREVEVFTTRPDTVCGVTFMSLAPEHPLTLRLVRGTEREEHVRAFVDRVRSLDRLARTSDSLEKEAVFTGTYCKNPVTGEAIPIWVANFVLVEYGTGAVMAVPGHDQRDFDLARRYGLPVRVVIQPDGETLDAQTMTEAWEGVGTMVRSGLFDGLPSDEGKKRVVAHLASEGLGKEDVHFRLRDWLISRQRYWGCPIPVVYCDDHGPVGVSPDSLPVVLPEDVAFTGTGASPLAKHEAFVRAACPTCGKQGRRETDTMDTFIDSSWYFLRYLSPKYEGGPVDPEAARAWMPVRQYIGGAEHATGHLIYARYWTRVLKELGMLPPEVPDEPFERYQNQGMVTMMCTREGCGRVHAMSKSHGNLVEPDSITEKFGADTARVFILFASPADKDLEWSDAGVEGAHRFLQRVWRIVGDRVERLRGAMPFTGKASVLGEPAQALYRRAHRSIDQVTRDALDRFQMNTAISACMELCNDLGRFEAADDVGRSVERFAAETLVTLLSPFAPHLSDEMWEALGGLGCLIQRPWPVADPEALREDVIEMAVQVNGKVRGTIRIPAGAAQELALQAARQDANVRTHLEGKTVKKVIYVPGKILNVVVV